MASGKPAGCAAGSGNIEDRARWQLEVRALLFAPGRTPFDLFGCNKNFVQKCSERLVVIVEKKDDYKQFCDQFGKSVKLGTTACIEAMAAVSGISMSGQPGVGSPLRQFRLGLDLRRAQAQRRRAVHPGVRRDVWHHDHLLPEAGSVRVHGGAPPEASGRQVQRAQWFPHRALRRGAHGKTGHRLRE
mmetsp:Transcript_31897/g.105825  ORF Transcript_31897/g.105825 Transcript_31897/m.105825 type:complete len:187 (-) Transcript_31897:500-1060(-)